MAEAIDVTERIEARDKPKPPAWPKQGTPEFEARIAAMRAGHAKRAQKQQAKAQRPAPAPEVIDVGEPRAVRMEPDPRPAEKAPAKGGRSRKGDEFEEAQVREYIQLGLDCLASLPGHEHWHRDDEQVRMISVPGTRCLNRIDRKLLERLRAVSDPAALIFGCVMVLGPSLVLEVQSVREKSFGLPGRQQAPAARPAAARQPEGQSGAWTGGDDFAGAGPISGNGAAPIPAPEGIPLDGLR